ncbi:hypothetical protein [Parapedobacter defluvii]|uniref:hypothetical protein n=1 Tax=Parapedobacter defluvii TaxID=2045106 RepID=UPI00333F2BD4
MFLKKCDGRIAMARFTFQPYKIPDFKDCLALYDLLPLKYGNNTVKIVMKKFSLFFCLLALCIQVPAYAQELPSPAEGKSLIIFTRPALDAPIIQFEYFDGEQFLGKIGPGSYLAYECEPGNRLLWGKSENREYLEAELEPNQTYIIETQVQTGTFQARIKLVPFDPKRKNAEKVKKRLLKRIAKRNEKRFNPAEAKEPDHWMRATINQGMADYEKMKKKNKEIGAITPDMHL